MPETTLISTFYSFQPFVAAAHAFSPSKIILVIAEDSKSKIESEIAKLKDVYGKVADISIVEVKGSDLLSIAERMIDILEKSEGKKIVNVSGGWKLLSQGVMYGCYARPELVDKIIVNNIEDNSIVELPKLCYGLSSAKKDLLEEIEKRKGRSISEIAKKLERTRGMIYQHLKELKDIGYVDEKFEITLAGKLVLL